LDRRLATKPLSTRRRTASARVIEESGCFAIQPSIRSRISADKRMLNGGVTPVAGLPLFFCVPDIDDAMDK
jgi:hypothetical protein